jgi:ATP:ADP antiporter, AAA family
MSSNHPDERGPGAERASDEAEPNRAMRVLRKVVDIEPGEFTSVAWSWLYFFALLASAFVLRPLRDSMGLSGGADKYPWLFTGTLVAMLLVSAPFAWLVTKLPRKRFIPVVYRVSIACLLAFWAAFEFLPKSTALVASYTFFIWFSVFNLFVVSVFRGFMADIWNLGQAKRLFGFIGVGGTLGALAGSWLANLLAKPIGSTRLVFVSVLLLEFAVFAVRRLVVIHRIDEAPTAAGNDVLKREVVPSDVWRGLKLVASTPYLRWIASYIFLYGLIGTFLYFQQGKLVEATMPHRDERTAYFAAIEFWVQLGTVVVQLFLTARLIRWFGITFALNSQPVVAMLGWVVLSIAMYYASDWAVHGFMIAGLVPELAVLAVVQILLRISNFATAQPAREALYTVVEREVKYKSKSFIDTFVYRLGDSLGAWAFLGLLKLQMALAGIALLTIPIAGVWIFVGRTLGIRQRQLTGEDREKRV